MGKSSKKKRRKERQRQDRLDQLSTIGAFGAINLSSSTSKSGLRHIAVHNETETDTETETANQSHDLSSAETDEASTGALSRNMIPSSRHLNVDATFASSTNRLRNLPAVDFVYPRNDADANNNDNGNGNGNTARHKPKPYVFGSSNADENDKDAFQNGSTDTRIASKTHQSIDDILYQREATGTQQNESSSVDVVVEVKNGKNDSPRIEPKQKHSDFDTPVNPLLNVHQQTESTQNQSQYLSRISVADAVRDKAGLRPRANSTDGELKLPQRGLCDERKVLECYRWRSSIGGSTLPKGLNNLGNTCYLNSTLQCLAYCPPLCQLLMNILRADENQHVPPTGSSKSSTKVNQGRNFTLLLAALFRRMHNDDTSKGALSPRRIVNAVPLLGSGSTRRNGYKFRPGRQEDSHEFLVHLLDAMNDGELREAGINANKSGWRDRLPVPRLDETTFVHRIFGGYLRSQVRCTDCGYRSNTYDPFLDLSLEISRNSCHSLSSAFNEFTRKETLDSQNRWKCSGCKKRVCATKQLTVFRPPLSLCVQLKRFTYGGGSFGGFRSGGGKKISKAIEFPAQLQLPLSDGRSCGYVLTGIVIHIGGSASSGHYTAYVQRPSSNGDRRWFHMDDSFVQPVSEQQVLRQQNAYVIMYCRQEVKVEFPTPPLRGSMTTNEAKELSLLRQKAKSMHTNETYAIQSGTDDDPDDETSTKSDTTSKNRSLLSATNQTIAARQSTSSSVSNRDVSLDASKVDHVTNNKDSIDKSVVNGGMTGCVLAYTELLAAGKATDGVAVVEKNGNHNLATKAMAPEIAHLGTESSKDKPESNFSISNSSIGAAQTVELVSSTVIAANVKDVEHAAMDQQTTKERSVGPQSKLSYMSIDRGEGGKVEVVVRSQFKIQHAWTPKTAQAQKDEDFALLGNIPVSKWGDEDDSEIGLVDRDKIVKDIQRAEQDRNRKRFLDRHDTMLDQGKTKKMKNKKVPVFHPHPSTPSSNAFQRIHGLKQKLELKRRSLK